MPLRDLAFSYGTVVTTPRYKLVSALGVVGSAVNPLTAGFLVNSATGSYFVPQVDIGTSRGVLWTSDTAGLDTFYGFYEDQAPGMAGSGPYVVTLTVNDGTDPIQNAVVSLTITGQTYFATTNVSGIATFSLANGTYDIAIVAAGFQFTPTTVVVSGATAATFSMSATVIPAPPAVPTKATIYGNVTITDASTLLGYTVTASLIGTGPFTYAGALIPRNVTTTTDAFGEWLIEVPGNNEITPTGSQWRFTQSESRLDRTGSVTSNTSVAVTTLAVTAVP